MTEKHMETERGRVYYWYEPGSNPNAKCLIFLHGLTADHTLFDKQIAFFNQKYFSKGCAEYSLLTWDAPAHGKSRPYKDFSYPHAADDLKLIMQTENIQKAVLIGQSMGGFISQTFLLKYPSMAEAFIGIDTCPFGEKYYSKSDKWWLRQVEWMSRLYPHKILIKAVAKSCTTTQYSYQNMINALMPYSKAELCHLMGIGFAGFLTVNQDMKIACPVLILVGEKDRTGKVIQYCNAWHQETGYPLHQIPNAAHNSNIDNPEAVNSLIEDFVNRLS